MENSISVVALESSSLSRGYERRFVIVNRETGEILDDAQGYGYKSAQKAYAAWGYKNRDKAKDEEKAAKREHIRKWMKEHKFFVKEMNTYAFEITKGSWSPDEKFDAKFVEDMFRKYELETDFTAAELLRVWRE